MEEAEVVQVLSKLCFSEATAERNRVTRKQGVTDPVLSAIVWSSATASSSSCTATALSHESIVLSKEQQPQSHRIITGSYLALLIWFTLAPASSRMRMISRYPRALAIMRGVEPS